jgi:hypothetical protein
MTRKHWLWLLAGLALGLFISGRIVLLAQDHAAPAQSTLIRSPREKPIESPRPSLEPADAHAPRSAPRAVNEAASAATLQDALLRPYRFPFARPTSLEQVCAHLRETLKSAVVLDLAALDRKTVEPEATVQLDLDGVRLKTGLKLLLDQVGLTYRVVPEDNLMIITDHEGSEDPAEKVWAELRALHRDLHGVQDSVEELRESLGIDGAAGPRVRKPTIIEEMPEIIEERPGRVPDKPGRAGEKPNGTATPPQGSRSTPSRIPLATPRRGL